MRRRGIKKTGERTGGTGPRPVIDGGEEQGHPDEDSAIRSVATGNDFLPPLFS